MSTPPVRRMNARTVGLAVAICVGLVGLIIVAWQLVSGPGSSAPQDITEPPPDIVALRPENPTDQGQLAGGSAPPIRIMDKGDPSRLAALLRAKRLDPLEGGRYEVEEPRAWFYLEDGRRLYVTAGSAHVYMPVRENGPESGVLDGGVTLLAFAETPPDVEIDPQTTPPIARVDTPTLSFDAVLGELSTSERVVASTPEIAFTGRGLTARIDEAREEIQIVEIEGDNSFRFNPTVGGQLDQLTGRSTRRPVALPVALQRGAQGQGSNVTLYHLVCLDDVVVTQAGRKIEADRLDAWTRLIDHRLPGGAIKAPHADSPIPPPERVSAPVPVRIAMWAIGQSADGPPCLAPMSDEDVTLTCAGRIRIIPLKNPPEPLRGDHVALRFTAVDTGHVRFADESRGVSGRAHRVDYGATTQTLRIAATEQDRLIIDAQDLGGAALTHLEYDGSTRLATATGPGSAHQAGAEERQIRWDEQAELELVERQGRSALREARFAGDVGLTDGRSALSCGFLRAVFADATDHEEDGTALSRLIAQEDVDARDADGGTLTCGRLDVQFVPGDDPQQPEPTALTATENVIASSGDSRISASLIEADLSRADDGDLVITTARAGGNVVFTRAGDEVTAEADQMRSDAVARIVELIGEEVVVTRGPTRFRGGELRLDESARRVEAFGPGSLEHFESVTDLAREGAHPVVTAGWDRSLTLDDREGWAEISGGAWAQSTPDAISDDRVRAERIGLRFTPYSESDDSQERRFLGATATGASEVLENGGPATVEARRYTLLPGNDASARTLERVLYVEGGRIIVDKDAQTVTVPGPGRLLVEDRSAAPRPSDDEPFALSGARGTSLFRWLGGMSMDRRNGTITMQRQVSLVHGPPGDAPVAEIECEYLEATLQEAEDGVDTEPGAELLAVTATGAVYAETGSGKQLIADSVHYDAVKGLVDAQASAGNLVTLFDAQLALPMTAGRLAWNLATDDVSITSPGAVVAPR